MSEQASPAELPEAPEPETPAGEAPAPEETDWQKRYEDTQSAYTQGQQELSRIRQEKEQHDQLIAGLQSTDPEVRAQAAQSLGLPFEFVDDTSDDDQMPYLTREEWQAFQAQQQQAQAQAQQQAAQESAIAQIDAAFETHPGLKELAADDREWVVAKALTLDPKMTPEGVPLPDIDAALEKFSGWDTGRMQRWRESKRAPAIKAGGQAGTQAVPDDATHTQRVAAMLERLEAES